MSLLVCRPFLFPSPEGCAHAVPAQQLLPGSAALPQSHGGGDRPGDVCHPTARLSLARTAAALGVWGDMALACPATVTSRTRSLEKPHPAAPKGFVDEEQPQLPLLAPAPGWACRQQTLFKHLGWEPQGPCHLPSPAPVPNTVPWQHMEL